MAGTKQANGKRDPLIAPNFMRCPNCRDVIEDPEWRLKSILRRHGLPCALCGTSIRLVGNHWYGLLFGGVLLILGGRLYSQEYPLYVSGLFFLLGVTALAWGVLNARLEPVRPKMKAPASR